MMLNNLRGSVRPVLSYVFGAALVAGFFLRMIPADSFLAISGTAVLFWFTSRQQKA